MKKELNDKDCEVLRNFIGVLEKFYLKMSSLSSSLCMMNNLVDQYSAIQKKTEQFINSKCENVTKDERVWHFKVPIAYRKQWNQLTQAKEQIESALQEYPRSLFIHLISIYDNFYSSLLKNYLTNSRGSIMLCGSDKSISYQDVMDCNSIDGLKERIIDKEIDILMRGDHKTQLNWLFSKVKGPFPIEDDLISHFIEIVERRNLFVHADGVVSKQYINICKENKCKLDESIKIGTQLDSSVSYFYNSVDILLELSSKLTIYLAKSMYKNCNDVDGLFADHIYNCLENYNYKVVPKIASYLKNWDLCNGIQMVVDVNTVLSYYLCDDEKNAKTLLSEIDWSNCSMRFLLAKAVLEKDWKQSAVIMKKIGKKSKEVTQQDYITWPLFEKFRGTSEFASAYKSLFGESFSSESVFENSQATDDALTSSNK